MAHFLLKTEPSGYSFDDLVREGETVWDGVTNNFALKNMRTMKAGDTCLIYHSGDEKAAVGIAKVTRQGYPDPKKRDDKLTVVNLKAVKKLRNPVTLASLKERKEFAEFHLIRIPRLSVMSVPDEIWEMILKMSEEE